MTVRKVSRRTALITLACGVGSGLLGACGSDGPAEEPASGSALPEVRWGFFRNYNPVYVGVEKGFFKEAGVAVKLTGTFNSGPAVVQAAGTGQIDGGHSAITGLAGAVAAGVKVCGIADSQTEFVDAPLQQWFVNADSPIKSIADLKGKKIATNALSGSFYYTALLALKKAGLGRADVQFVNLPHDKQGQALQSKQVDVAGVIDPYSVQLSKNSAVRRLFTGAEILGERQFSLIFFTRSFVAKNPETVQKFLTGYRKTIEFMKAEPAAASTIMAKALGLQSSDIVPHRYTENAAIRADDVQFWIDTMRANGELKDAPGLKSDDLLDPSFHG